MLIVIVVLRASWVDGLMFFNNSDKFSVIIIILLSSWTSVTGVLDHFSVFYIFYPLFKFFQPVISPWLSLNIFFCFIFQFLNSLSVYRLNNPLTGFLVRVILFFNSWIFFLFIVRSLLKFTNLIFHLLEHSKYSYLKVCLIASMSGAPMCLFLFTIISVDFHSCCLVFLWSA